MKKFILHLFILCFIAFLSNCSKEDIKRVNPAGSSTLVSTLKSTNALRGINWADPNGNAPASGVVLPSGMTSSLTTTQAASVAKAIADAVKVSGGTTIRMPINYGTTSNATYWPVYQAAINAITADGCTVILCYWSTAGGIIDNTTQWQSMWDSVNTIYKSNSKVLYEPINEPYSFTTANLLTLYANFLTRYSPTSLKLILDGTGYAAEVLTVGADSRFNSQYLGLHCYWWFWGTYNVWTDAYNKMASLVGSYASRTVVTEIGVETFRTFDFWWQWTSGLQPDQAFLTGSLAYAKDNAIGTIAWSGVNDIDTYRWYTSHSTLTEINPGCANMYRWAWGLSAKWIGPIANGTFKIQNRASGLYLDSYGLTTSPSPVYQYTSSTSTNQNWQVVYVNGYYTLYSLSGGLCLDAGSNTSDGSSIQQLTRGTSTSQQWTITLASTGYYKFTNRATGKCLDTGGLTASGSIIQQWYSGSSYNQEWKLVQQ